MGQQSLLVDFGLCGIPEKAIISLKRERDKGFNDRQ